MSSISVRGALLVGILVLSIAPVTAGGSGSGGSGATVTASSAPSGPTTPAGVVSADGDRWRQAADTASQTGWGLEAVYGTEELRRPGGGEGVTVAVVDSGVDVDHPDIADRIAGCFDALGGRIVRGRCGDGADHGTAVAGIVAADAGPRDAGLWGVAPDAEILAYRACEASTRCGQDAVEAAVRDAVDAGADVVLLSLGNAVPGGIAGMERAADHDTLVVAAAGNGGPDLGTMTYPAGDPSVVSVGAIERDVAGDTVEPSRYAVPPFSGRGRDVASFVERDGVLELAAPGEGVGTLAAGGGYRRRSGTSFAAPFVAGLAARLWSRVDDRGRSGKRDDVRRALRERARSFDVRQGRHAGPGYDPAAGLGMPQARTARPAIAVDPAVPTRGETATLRARDESDGTDVRYAWRFPGANATARGATVTHVFQQYGRLSVVLRATAPDGTVVTTRPTVRINAPPTAMFRHAPAVPLVGEPVALDGRNASDPEGAIERSVWDVDGDGAVDREGARVTVSFDRPGRHAVTFRVTDGDGATDAVTREVLVNDRPSIADVAPTRVTADAPATLRATVDDEVGRVAVEWRFPDGSVREGRNVTASLAAGSHDVVVVAEDEHGARTERNVTLVAEESSRLPTGLPQSPWLPPAVLALAAVAVVAWRRRRRDGRS